MDELSYNNALALGIQPVLYRSEILAELGEGVYRGELDALVWGRYGAPAHLQALIALDCGPMVRLAAYHQHNKRGETPYQGFREFSPGEIVNVVVVIGPRGGVRARMEKIPELCNAQQLID